MHAIINKTYELIDALEESEMIRDLVFYKEKVLQDPTLMELLHLGKEVTSDYALVSIKKKLYENDTYHKYMDCYASLSYLVMDFNHRMNQLIDNRSCGK